MTAIIWRKARASHADNACVEVAAVGGRVAVRDSKLGDRSPVVVLDGGQWRALLGRVKAGRP